VDCIIYVNHLLVSSYKLLCLCYESKFPATVDGWTHTNRDQAFYIVGGTAAAVPLPLRHVNPALCGSRPLVTPCYCRLGDLLCFVFMYDYCVNCVIHVSLQYFDIVSWVFWPVKTVARITYTVLVETLNHALSLFLYCRQIVFDCYELGWQLYICCLIAVLEKLAFSLNLVVRLSVSTGKCERQEASLPRAWSHCDDTAGWRASSLATCCWLACFHGEQDNDCHCSYFFSEWGKSMFASWLNAE